MPPMMFGNSEHEEYCLCDLCSSSFDFECWTQELGPWERAAWLQWEVALAEGLLHDR